MALGYLNLASNPLPLESLRPLARAHILELHLGNGHSAENRERMLSLLPNLWVLDEEFVNARERRIAEDTYHHVEAGAGGGIQLLLTQADSAPPDKATGFQDRDGLLAGISASQEGVPGEPPNNGSSCASAYGDLTRQGRHARKFYEEVVWRLPSR